MENSQTKNKDNFDPFKAFHDNEPPKVIHFYCSREDFYKYAVSICADVDYTTKRVIVKAIKDDFSVTIFNPLRNPELIIKSNESK